MTLATYTPVIFLSCYRSISREISLKAFVTCFHYLLQFLMTIECAKSSNLIAPESKLAWDVGKGEKTQKTASCIGGDVITVHSMTFFVLPVRLRLIKLWIFLAAKRCKNVIYNRDLKSWLWHKAMTKKADDLVLFWWKIFWYSEVEFDGISRQLYPQPILTSKFLHFFFPA